MKLMVKNRNNREIMVFLEPWADEFILKSNEELTFIGKNTPKDSYFYIVHEQYDLVIYAEWESALVDVINKDGDNISGNSNIVKF